MRSLPATSLLLLALGAGCPKEDTGTDQPVIEDKDGDGIPAELDCNDFDPAFSPNAPEVCNGLDDDCDGTVDEDDAIDARTWYADADGDTWGSDQDTVLSCHAPDGYLGRGGDCDDHDLAFNPNAPETDCTDPTDYNCDGQTLWADEDRDGSPACLDCDDWEATIHPDADELCNGWDDDCDGNADEGNAADAPTWYLDSDEDGYGDEAFPTRACQAQPGTVSNSTDCDDQNPYVNPGVDELCNGGDDDCDGGVDEDARNASTWYVDMDGDRYGAGTGVRSCETLVGYTTNDDDCNDLSPSISPRASETCNGVDDDCDGMIDDGTDDATVWYYDTDMDNYGDPSSTFVGCTQPAGTVSDGTDCNDEDPTVNPGMVEACDGLDNDCDGSDDDGLEMTWWYQDADSDGHGDASALWIYCEQPEGYVADATDCDDTDSTVHPDAEEVDCDGLDSDCDGLGYPAGAPTDGDADADGWAACEDCDEANAEVHPNAAETCNGLDDDCDGEVDPSWAVGYDTYYIDADGDGYGDSDTAEESCTALSGYVTLGGDCDDTNPRVYPGRGCDAFFTTAYIAWSWAYAILDGSVTSATVYGETVPPTFTVWLMNEDYVTTFSDDDICYLYYDMSLEDATLSATAWQDWNMVDLSYRASSGEGCALLDPSMWGSEPEEAVLSLASSYGFVVEDPDAATEDMILPYLGDEYGDWLLAGRLFLDGADVYPDEQTFYGFGYTIDAAGEVDLESFIDASTAADPADAWYDIEPIYLFTL